MAAEMSCCEMRTAVCNLDFPKEDNNVAEEEEDDSLNLLDLPLEIFLKICSYLEADFIPTLSLVCRRFEDILSDGALWRCWVSRRLKHSYPALKQLHVWKAGAGVNWQAACGDIDRETRRWRHMARTVQHRVVQEGHFATVDSVLLFNNSELCISGGRDRALALWSLPEIRACGAGAERDGGACVSVSPGKLVHDAHRGWVWDLAVDAVDAAATVFSGSWDNTLKSWDLERNLEHKETYKCNMSVLSVVAEQNIVMAGLYSRQVYIFDVRAGTEPILKYKLHKGPVLKLQKLDGLIGSLSEDRTIGVWDQKAGKAFKSDIKCTPDGSFPVCFSWCASAMYVGDSKGSVHLLDPEELVHKQSYELWPEPQVGTPCDKVTGLYQGLGSLIVASDKGQIKCLYPSDPLEQFAEFQTSASLITNIHYENDVLVVGACNSSLEFWIPTEVCD